MLKYILVLVATLVVELLACLAGINFMFNTMISETANATVYVFGGPVTIFVMGLTVAMFDTWRCRIVVDALYGKNGFRASRG